MLLKQKSHFSVVAGNGGTSFNNFGLEVMGQKREKIKKYGPFSNILLFTFLGLTQLPK